MSSADKLTPNKMAWQQRISKRKDSVPISRVLYLLAVADSCHTSWCLSFIYSVCHHTAQAFYPLPRTGNPYAAVYMNLQFPRRTAVMSP